jgi:hypothetical protein
MKIYTGSCFGTESKILKIKEYGLGIMISSESNKKYSEIDCALDNGAFECWRRGIPWTESRFFETIEKCYKTGVKLDFVVLPDIVCGGKKSLNYSMTWLDRLQPAKLALAVQDGMTSSDVQDYDISGLTYIFIGGSVDWKWKTANEWVEFAHYNKLKCHIGRCGTIERLRYAESLGVDSVDSTSFVRNDSWHIIEQFYNGKTLF